MSVRWSMLEPKSEIEDALAGNSHKGGRREREAGSRRAFSLRGYTRQGKGGKL